MVRTPRNKRQGETERDIVSNRFIGEYADMPASDIPEGAAWKNKNCIDRGDYTEGRAGSKIYTEVTKPTGVLYGHCDHKKSGFILRIYGEKLYVSNKALTYFEEVLKMFGVQLSSESEIVEFNDDAVIFNSTGIYLVVLSDTFKYVRKMNVPLPDSLITDVEETAEKIFGYRYIYSFIQRGGNETGVWNRISGDPFIFESGTNAVNEQGKDFGQVYFTEACGPFAEGNIVGDFVVPWDTLPDTKTITDFGIYRTLQIGQHTDPPGTGLGGLGNNETLLSWIKDIPVAKAFLANQAGDTVTLLEGHVSREDNGCTVYFYDAGGFGSYTSHTIVSVIDEHHYLASDTETRSQVLAGIGHGRLFSGYQSGDRFFADVGTPFVAGDVGCPIWLADGRVIWIKEFVSSSEVVVGISQELARQAATMHPPEGEVVVFGRKYNDNVIDDSTITSGEAFGEGAIGLKQRIASGQDLYWPRRFFIPLPSGDTGHIDLGFLFVCNRDDTEYQYSQVGDKKYTLGYYRADHQKEKIDTHIKKILTVNGVFTILLSNMTRIGSPQSATDVGNNSNAETVFKIPPTAVIDNKGVVLWRTIAYKNGNIIAVTNEPAVRIFNGSAWSTENFAERQVQKFIETIDHDEVVYAIYIPGRYGGYHLWFKRWVEA